MAARKTIDVAVAVVVDADDRVLISFRHPDLHQGNLWEFPGGKCEPGESIEMALQRELLEELNVQVLAGFPFKTICYDYPDKSVRLHVWRVTEFSGEVQGMEGQSFRWRAIADLRAADFPAANAPIVRMLQLPPMLAITPQVNTMAEMEITIVKLLARGSACIQLRQPQLAALEYAQWFEHANSLCRQHGATLIFNGDITDFHASSGEAYHANSSRLMALSSRPVPAETLFGCSCHSLAQLQQAVAVEADFASLSPVLATAKYPSSSLLGWDRFSKMKRQVSLPVYALGGLRRDDLARARRAGAHGICGIGMFLD